MKIISTILLVGAIQGVFLTLFLVFNKQGNRVANRILAANLAIFSLSIILHAFIHSILGHQFPLHEIIMHTIFILVAPLLFLYIKSLTQIQYHFTSKEVLHFLPFLTGFTLGLVRITIFYEYDASSLFIFLLEKSVWFILAVTTAAYLMLSIIKLKHHFQNIQSNFSYLEKITLNWLKYILIAYIISFSLALIFEFSHNSDMLYNYFFVLIAIFMYSIGYIGLKQPVIFSGDFYINQNEPPIQRKKYEKSALDEEKAELYFKRLNNVIQTEKPYLRSDLTLPDLAKLVSISTHHLSQIINEKLNQNFFEFINGYRVEEAKNLFATPQRKDYNISHIAFDVGFNSLSAFNAAFKKYTQTTPSQYRKQFN